MSDIAEQNLRDAIEYLESICHQDAQYRDKANYLINYLWANIDDIVESYPYRI